MHVRELTLVDIRRVRLLSDLSILLLTVCRCVVVDEAVEKAITPLEIPVSGLDAGCGNGTTVAISAMAQAVARAVTTESGRCLLSDVGGVDGSNI